MILLCVLLIRTDISSMCQLFVVEFLLTEEENEEKWKENKVSEITTGVEELCSLKGAV